MVVGSKELIRDINSKLVMQTIIEHNTISRASIAKLLGLTKATVSSITQELINKKLIVEIGSDDTQAGRKPILLALNHKAGYVISIHISAPTISILLSDLSCDDRYMKQIKMPTGISSLSNTLIELIESLKKPEDTSYGLVGITIGIHGFTTNNRIYFDQGFSLPITDLTDSLGKSFHAPVYLEYESDLAALGEMAFQYHVPNIICMQLKSNIDLATINEHKLYSHRNRTNHSFGHTIIDLEGRSCYCGNHGCLVQYISDSITLQELGKKKKLPDITLETFKSLYEVSDPDALSIIDSFTRYLSVGINNVLQVFDTDVIVINSSLIHRIPKIIDQIRDTLTDIHHKDITIVASSLFNQAPLLGGVYLAVKQFLEVEYLYYQYD